MVFYFSGTGNSKYIAKRIAEATNDNLYSINEALKADEYPDFSDNKVIFSLPTYAWRIPKVVEAWIKKSTFSPDASVYFVMNCGGEIGNSEKYILKLCNSKGFRYMGCAEVVMPENYLAMFSVPNEEQSRRIIAKREGIIDSICATIKSGAPLPAYTTNLQGRVMSSIINPLFYSLCVKDKGFKVDNDKCISCGKCAKECPLNNITIGNKTPVWNGNCTHCMACITICPTEAIEYGNNSKDKPRYRCPL